MKNLLVAFLFLISFASCKRDVGTQIDPKSYIGKELIIDSVTYVLVDYDTKKEYLTDKGTNLSLEFVTGYLDSTQTNSPVDSLETDTTLPSNEVNQ